MDQAELKKLAESGEVQTLEQYLKENPHPDGFSSEPHYIHGGDYLVFFFKDEPCYAQRIDDLLTVYQTNDSSELVGFKIKGLSRIAKHVASLIDIRDENIAINLLLLSAVGSSPAQKKYYDLGEHTRGVTIKRASIPHLAGTC